MSATISLETLPEALIQRLLAYYVDDVALCHLALAGRAWHALAREDNEMWKLRCCDKFKGQFTFQHSWMYTCLTLENPARKPPTKPSTRKFAPTFPKKFPNLVARIRREEMAIETFDLEQRAHVERISFRDLTDDLFEEKFDKGNKPCIITDLVPSWPAAAQWKKDAFLERFGETIFATTQMDATGKKIAMKVKDYFQYMKEQTDEAPVYMFEANFGEKRPDMLEQYKPPTFLREDYFEALDPKDRPTYRWVIIGPQKSGTPFHIDPYNTEAWNALLQGRKRWFMFPPGVVPPGVRDPNETWVDENEDGYDRPNAPAPLDWLTQFYHLSLPNMLECVQHAGEMIFVPTGWWHMVLNLEDTISVTQNVGNRYNWTNVWKDITTNHKDLAEKFRAKYKATNPELVV